MKATIIQYVILGSLLFFISCNSTHEGFIIQGKVNGGKGKTIYLSYEGKNDSVVIDSKNEFKFTGTLIEPNFCNLYLDRTNPILLFIDSLNNITIEIETDAEQFANMYTVKGSATSQQIHDIQKRLIETYNNIKNLYKNTVEVADSSTRDSLHTYFVQKSNELVNQHRQFIANFIQNYPSSFAILPAIYQAFDSRNPVFTYENDAPLFHLVDSLLMKHHPQSMHTKEFHAQLVQYKQLFPSVKPQLSNLQQFDEAPDFTLPTYNGQKFTLSSLRGNYVLLDFWASWCKPCRIENPSLVEAYKLFNKQKFQIVQVSLDQSKEQWINAIHSDNLSSWIHVSDLKYWNCEVAKLYGVQAIPANFLIDPKGKIIAQNLRGEDLINTLAQIFDKKAGKK